MNQRKNNPRRISPTRVIFLSYILNSELEAEQSTPVPGDAHGILPQLLVIVKVAMPLDLIRAVAYLLRIVRLGVKPSG